MRIIGGEHRGRKLIPPTDKNIRPTGDRMRETIFNILTHTHPGLQGANILDVFAGTGALGLEAISRGAVHATFFDSDRKSLQITQKNIAFLGLETQCTTKIVKAPELPTSEKQYDYIFLDPPYHLDIIPDTLSALAEHHYCARHCIIVAEYSSKTILNPITHFDVLKEKKYGEAQFIFFKYTL